MPPIEVAIAIITRADKILICHRRATDTFPNKWEFPGGKREPNESLDQTLDRELMEELGLKVQTKTPLPPITHQYENFSVRLHPFLCALIEAEPKPTDGRRILWIPSAALRDYPFPAANAGLIEELIAHFSYLHPT